MKTITTSCLGIVLLVLTSATLLGSPVILSDNFTGLSGALPKESGANAAQHWWFSNSYTNIQLNLWGGGNVDTYYHSAMDGLFYRNLRTGGELSPAQSVTGPALQGTVSMQWGGDGQAGMCFYISLLDQNNNGYLGKCGRNQEMWLYRVDGGTRTQIAYSSSAGISGNRRNLHLCKSGNDVIFSYDALYSYGGAPISGSPYIVAADETYHSFVKIGFGGGYAASERLYVDDVSLTGDVVPEPFILADNFTGLSGALPTASGANAAQHWWYSDNYANIQLNLWGGGNVDTYYHSAMDGLFYRNLRTGGELSPAQSVTGPALQGTVSMQWGGDGQAGMCFYISLLDQNNNGYLGKCGRNQEMWLYRVDGGTRTQIAYSSSAGISGNRRNLHLCKSGNDVIFSYDALYSCGEEPISGSPYIVATDTTYNSFVKIGFGGGYTASERLYVDDVSLTGVIAPEPAVTINFAADNGSVTYRASGFLHALSPTEPEDGLIIPLKPKLFRKSMDFPPDATAFNCAARVAGLGAQMQVVLSDSWAGPGLPGDNGDWSAWEGVVNNRISTVLENDLNFEFDVWNEPNGVWAEKTDQFNEMWRRTVDQVRLLHAAYGKNPPVFVGPSISVYSPTLLHSFLLYCKTHYDSQAANVLPNTLSWHEIPFAPAECRNIPSHVNEIRSWMTANGINIQDIDLNEIINVAHTRPGITGWFLTEVEAAKVKGACHACWFEPPNWLENFNGYNNSLDGLLTYSPPRVPRSTWWVYKGYADLSGNLVGLTPNNTVTGMTSQDSVAQVSRSLLARDGGATADMQLQFINMGSVPYLSNPGRVRVIAARIPDSGWGALTAPTTTVDALYPVVNNQVSVTLPAFGFSDAYTVCILPNAVLFSDGFESGIFDAWSSRVGCSIQTANKYSGTYAAQFNFPNELVTNTSTAGKKNIQISYVRKTAGCTSSYHFYSEWYNGTGWTTLENLAGNSGWVVKTFNLPAGAENNANFRLRFKTTPSGSGRYAYLDDVKIIGENQ